MRQILWNWLFIAVLFTGVCCVKAQCPTGDIQLSTQAEIDQFATNYPGCTELQGRLLIIGTDISDLTPLQSITSVNGLIVQYTQLVDLNGLQNIVTDNGQLSIYNNSHLADISALNGITQVTDFDFNSNEAMVNMDDLNALTTITGMARINWNNTLQTISGFSNLTTIGNDLELKTNPLLTDLSGFSSLSSIGSLIIMSNNSLQNVDGFSSLTEFSGTAAAPGLNIASNPALDNLEGFSNLTNMAHSRLRVFSNAALTSLTGLDNIDPTTISNLTITSSQQLSTCNVSSICDYLSAGGTATISGNSVGCSSVAEVQTFCEGFDDCPEGDVTLSSQADVNLFTLQYPDCTTILGNLYIGSETDVTNITNISGLQNILNVVGKVTIRNTSLQNLSGLNTLEQIGGGLTISDNAALISLEALTNLTSISGSELAVVNNDALASLSGLDNIDPATISNLVLESSQNLTTCNIESICFYISTIGSTYSILGNATGCSSFEEVLEACESILPECPEGDIEFLTQAEVDHFSIQFPNCENLNGMLKIGGVVESDISDLSSLQNIVSVKGAVVVSKTSLSNLQGLNNLQTIEFNNDSYSSLEILYNNSLTSLEGLENFTSSNNIFILGNSALMSLQGLTGLTGFPGVISISSNNSLLNLSGLDNLNYCFKLDISGNESLQTLEGLNNLENIVGDFTLNNNPSLTTLSALENLETIYGPGDNGFGGWMRLQECDSLMNLEGLNNLSSLNGMLLLSNDNLESISALSGLTVINGEEMGAINQIEIGGNNSLTSLHGLHNITSIGYIFSGSGSFGTTGKLLIYANPVLEDVELTSLERVYGDLQIANNPLLTSLEGLNNLERIEANLDISDNALLTSLDGLNSLTHFGVMDGWPNQLFIRNNASLQNIQALENLSNINDQELNLYIINNPLLTSLEGLDNINASSFDPYIQGIVLMDNAQLSQCSVTPVCEWLSDGGINQISANAANCNSANEILDICALSVEEVSGLSEITFYPVPTKEILNIQTQNGTIIIKVEFYDLNGKLVYSSKGNDSKIDISHLATGTYLTAVTTSKGVHTEKIIKK